MPTIDVAEFAEELEALALRFESADLPGLLSKRLTVPAGALALVRDPDGSERLLRAGDDASGSFAAVLAKTHDQSVSFQVESLRTQDGHATQAGLEVVVRLPQRELHLKALQGTLLKDRQALALEDLRAYLLPYVQGGLAAFIRERTAEQLMTEDPRAALDEVMRSELTAAAFSAGLEALEVRHPSFYCEEFERLRRARIEASLQQEELRRFAELQELRARIERNEHLKRHEIDELAKVLEYQGVVKELELKHEVDRKRKQEELQRFEAIQAQVGKDDLKALIFLLEDDRLKAQLIQQLIERDMSEEQLRARRAEDVEQRLEERLQRFAKGLELAMGQRQRRVREGGQRTRRLVVVYGKQAVAYDPATNVQREAPKETYDLRAGPLGYLRSVRPARTKLLGPVLMLGAQGGVYICRDGQGADGARELRFPRAPEGQGGVNATAYFDGWVYASHSELGVFRWDLDGLVRAEALFGTVTARNDATRGVVVTADGKLYFASGADIYRHDLVRPDQPLTAFRGTGDGITAFVDTRDELFAGTRGGRVLRWSLLDPGSPRELNLRKANPVFMLRIAEIGGAPHLLVGAKEHGLTAVSIEDGRSTEYRAPDQIRWVDGATDFVFGVTRSGYTTHVWKADRPDEPSLAFHAPDRIQDIALVKEPLADLA